MFNCAGLLEQCWLWLDCTLSCGVKMKRARLLKKIWQFPPCLREHLLANLLSSNHYFVVSVKTVIARSHYNLHPKVVPRQHFQLLRPTLSLSLYLFIYLVLTNTQTRERKTGNCWGQTCLLKSLDFFSSVENPQNNSITIIYLVRIFPNSIQCHIYIYIYIYFFFLLQPNKIISRRAL